MNKSCLIICWIILIHVFGYSQKMTQLATNQLSSGKIVYSENAKDSSALVARSNFLKEAKIVLKNETKEIEVKIVPKVGIKMNALLVFVTFEDDTLKVMVDDEFALYVNNNVIARTETVSMGTKLFKLDLKPSFDSKEAQKVDIEWGRKFSETNTDGLATNYDLKVRGAFSSKPDSASLNSVQFDLGYSMIWDVETLKYLGLSGKLKSEHPQDFSQTNMIGSVVASTIIPFTDRIARFITNNIKNSSIGLVFQPSVEFVKNTTIKDSSYIRGVVQGSWDIPFIKDQYINIYGAAYFRKGDRPRSYIEMTFEQDLSESIAIVAKWVNGELPPLFQREADLRIGLRFK